MKRKQGDFKGETYTTVFQKKWDFSPTDYVQNAIFSKTPLFLAPLIKKKEGECSSSPAWYWTWRPLVGHHFPRQLLTEESNKVFIIFNIFTIIFIIIITRRMA